MALIVGIYFIFVAKLLNLNLSHESRNKFCKAYSYRKRSGMGQNENYYE
ncbi:hypothetical protein KU05112810_1740003 [Flavobacterium psychrophilum]|nr:hypothetical protein KU05112810_1740003 [Flavobacterium psychrophilum]